jgi:hypothetical protein
MKNKGLFFLSNLSQMMPLLTSSFWMLFRSPEDYGNFIEYLVVSSYLCLGTVFFLQNSLPALISDGRVGRMLLIKLLFLATFTVLPFVFFSEIIIVIFCASLILRPFFDIYFSLLNKFQTFYIISIIIELVKIIFAISIYSLENVILFSQGIQIIIFGYFTYSVLREANKRERTSNALNLISFFQIGKVELSTMTLRSLRGNIVILMASVAGVESSSLGLANYVKRLLEGMSSVFKFKEFMATGGVLFSYSNYVEFILLIFTILSAGLIGYYFDVELNFIAIFACLCVWLKWQSTSQRSFMIKYRAWNFLFLNEILLLIVSSTLIVGFICNWEVIDIVYSEFILTSILIYIFNVK